MRVQHSAYVAAFLMVAGWVGLPAAMSAQPGGPAALVMLQNDAEVPAEVAAKAQAEVVRLYRLIGVEVNWVMDVAPSGRRVHVVSLVKWQPADNVIPPSVLGVTYGDPGRRGHLAYVFWRRVERAAQKFTTPEYNLLAAAIAHELGHMLLPDGSHAKRGLMVEGWNSGHFRLASAGFLQFSNETAVLIRRGLLEEVTVAALRRPE